MKIFKFLFLFLWSIYGIGAISQNANHYSIADWIIAIIFFSLPFIYTKIKNQKRKSTNSLKTKESQAKQNNYNNKNIETDLYAEYGNTNSDDYLKQILPNGNTIREQQEENLINSLSSNAPNERTDEEEGLINNFFFKYEQTLSLAEEKLYNLVNDIGTGKNLDERIIKVRKVISHYEHFKDFCYSKGTGGIMYFDDMWEHCHNSKNPDFSYIDQFKELLEKWIERRDERDEMASIRKELLSIVKEKPGILQKDLYIHFNTDYKVAIRGEMMELEKDGILRRVRHGNTYELYLN